MDEVLGTVVRADAYAVTAGSVLLFVEGDHEGEVAGYRLALSQGKASASLDRLQVLVRPSACQVTAGYRSSWRAVAVFRLGSPLPKVLSLEHAGGVTRITVSPLPAEGPFVGINRLLEASEEAARDGVLEGLGFSVALDLGEAVRGARDQLAQSLSIATSSSGAAELPPAAVAWLAESGVLDPMGACPVLYARLRLPPALL